MMYKRCFLIILYILCCSKFALADADPDENIHINADKMSHTEADALYIAEGNVVVNSKNMNLVADKVQYNSVTHILNASGSVVLSKGTTVLKGETAQLNIETLVAEMNSTTLKVPQSGMTLTATKLVRINEDEYSATSTELTSCDMPDPSWKFGADKLEVDLQGYATGRHIIFYIKDIPVLYLPWIAFPVVLEKRSGILFPRIGYSKSKGGQIDIPLYWVISPSQDITFDFDLMTRHGLGSGLDYRYIRKRGSEGRITPYLIYDLVEDRWRWQLTQEHKEIFSNSANLRMSVNATGDRKFLTDFGDKNGDYNRQSSDTRINILKTWQNFAVTSSIRYNEDLYAPDNKGTVQILPSIGISTVRDAIFSLPLYFDIDSTLDNIYRETSPSGQRLQLFPRITMLPYQNRYLQTSIFAGAHIRGYKTDRRIEASEIKATDGDIIPEAALRLSSSFTRIYDVNNPSLKKIRHEIVPEIRYTLQPESDQERLPFYDYSDRLTHKNLVSLSLISKINGKFVLGDRVEYLDVSRIKVAADYKIDGERRDLLTLVEDQHRWSNIIFESETYLSRELQIKFDARYNAYENYFSSIAAGVEFDDRAGNSLAAAYQKSRNEVEYFEGRLATKFIRPLNLSYTARYSFDLNDFLESIYSAEYRHKCWSINFAIHQRPGNQSYTVNFNLAGLGSK